MIHYFAYGSNMDAEQMRPRGVYFSSCRKATLEGYALSFSKLAKGSTTIGFANILPEEKSMVEGVLYLLDGEEDLQELDHREGVTGGQYERAEVPVITDTGEVIWAIAYIALPDRVRKGLKPTRSYLQHLLAARDILSPEYGARPAQTETLD